MFVKVAAVLLIVVSLYTVNAKPGWDLNGSATNSRTNKYKLSYADYNTTWTNFKRQYNKDYYTTKEEAKRFDFFMENVKMIESHNWKYHNKRSTFWMDINQYSDMTPEERMSPNNFQKVNHTKSPALNIKCSEYHPTSPDVPSEMDWRVQGYVTPVQTQDGCSEYVYSVAGAVEGQWFAKMGSLVSLSKQQIRDCSTSYGNYGCHSGQLDHSFEYLVVAGGLESEADYPTQEMTFPCRFESSKAVAKIRGCKKVAFGEYDDMMKAVGIGPISISMWTENNAFYHYAGGVYDDDDCNPYLGPYPRYMLIVGYGSLDSQDYWVVKNSFGANWGENGYIKIARNKGNLCGILSEGYFPVV